MADDLNKMSEQFSKNLSDASLSAKSLVDELAEFGTGELFKQLTKDVRTFSDELGRGSEFIDQIKEGEIDIEAQSKKKAKVSKNINQLLASANKLEKDTLSKLKDQNGQEAKNLRDKYRENEKVKFRFGCRLQYLQKTFSTSVQTTTGSFIPNGSGSYSIIDMGTNEAVVPFSPHTSMSCDATSNYFIQWLNGFYPDRYYKILIKLKNDDGQEIIHDNNFEFKVVR